MTYDPSDTGPNDNNADGKETFEQVTTESIDNGGSPIDIGDILNRLDMADNNTTVLYQALLSATDAGGEIRVRPQDGISTNATSIMTISDDATGGLVIVQGDEDGGTARFFELVHVSFGPAPSVVNTLTENAPAGRTYSRVGDEIGLAMASGTYDVTSIGVLSRRDPNATS